MRVMGLKQWVIQVRMLGPSQVASTGKNITACFGEHVYREPRAPSAWYVGTGNYSMILTRSQMYRVGLRTICLSGRKNYMLYGQ